MTYKKVYLGADLSVNHGAIVAADEGGSLINVYGYTFKKKDASVAGYTRLMGSSKGLNRQQVELDRLNVVYKWITTLRERLSADGIVLPACEVVLALEDYAFGSHTIGQHCIAEVVGVFKVAMLRWGCRTIRWRLMPPGSIPLFVLNQARAEKDDIKAAVQAGPWPGVYYGMEGDTEGDVYDAFSLAHLARTEDLVRGGHVTLEKLQPGARAIFLRTTKAYPENLLARPYLI